MKPSAQHSFAERLGQILGRMWRGCLRQERKMNGWTCTCSPSCPGDGARL
ncbi:DUF3742 family protein [Stutzerimonas chloritidismutans]